MTVEEEIWLRRVRYLAQHPWTYFLCDRVPPVQRCFWMDLRWGLVVVSSVYLAAAVVTLSLAAWFHDQLDEEFKKFELGEALAICSYVLAVLEIGLAFLLLYILPYLKLSPHLLVHQWIKGLMLPLYLSCSSMGFVLGWEVGVTYLLATGLAGYVWVCTNSLYQMDVESPIESSRSASVQSGRGAV